MHTYTYTRNKGISIAVYPSFIEIKNSLSNPNEIILYLLPEEKIDVVMMTR